jgi:hemerythrin-like domain-containing protein
MLIKMGPSADHGFDEPLGLLSDCHRRIEHFLATLVAIAATYRGSELRDADRRALETALHYFVTAGPRHSADEEESLFPRVRMAEDAAARAAYEKLRRLEADHRVAESHHDAVTRIGRQWLSDGTLAEPDVQALTEHLAELERLYREHIAIEDHDVFPAAARVLSAADVEAVGREMAVRRGLAFGPPQPASHGSGSVRREP